MTPRCAANSIIQREQLSIDQDFLGESALPQPRESWVVRTGKFGCSQLIIIVIICLKQSSSIFLYRSGHIQGP